MSGDKRRGILQAAEKEFLKCGYQKASITRIAAEAGVAVGTVYSYFKSKENLFEAVRQPELKDYNPAREEKKAEILKAALKEFGEKGYAAATMETIANIGGCNKAVLYQYFRSKEELFTALFYEPKFACSLDSLRFLQADADLYEILKDMGMAFLELFEDTDRTNILKMVISEANRFPQLGTLMYENTIQKVAENVADILMQLAVKGIVSQMDFRLAARAYFGLLYSFVLTDKILNPQYTSYNNEQIVSFAAHVFSKGLQL